MGEIDVPEELLKIRKDIVTLHVLVTISFSLVILHTCLSIAGSMRKKKLD